MCVCVIDMLQSMHAFYSQPLGELQLPRAPKCHYQQVSAVPLRRAIYAGGIIKA